MLSILRIVMQTPGGGGEFLAYAWYFNPAFVTGSLRRGLKLYAHPGVRSLLWSELEHSTVLPDKAATLADYFDVQNHNNSFDWQGVTFELIPTVHCIDNGKPTPCFGLTWKTKKQEASGSVPTPR